MILSRVFRARLVKIRATLTFLLVRVWKSWTTVAAARELRCAGYERRSELFRSLDHSAPCRTRSISVPVLVAANYFCDTGAGGSGGRVLVRLPTAAFAQYPLPGRGICSFRQVLARATSETPYSGANFPIGCDHTCS